MAGVETACGRREVRETFTFTIQLDVDPRAVQAYYRSDNLAVTLVQGEIESWLESLSYVRNAEVRRRA